MFNGYKKHIERDRIVKYISIKIQAKMEMFFIWVTWTFFLPLVDLATLNEGAFGNCETKSYFDDNVIKYCTDCSYLNLTDVPKNLPLNITCLNMIGNKMTQVNRTSLQRYRNLKELSLARNIIDTLREGDFDGLSKLEMLDLSLNCIRYNNIHADVFKLLSSLIFLDIKQSLSNIKTNEHYPEALKYLINLQTLVIDGLGTHVLPKLPHLTELYMSGEYGRCNIPHISGYLFENIMNVQNIFLSNCSIKKVDFDSFKSLQKITSLDMSWNINLGMESVPNITSGLAGSQTLKKLNLNTLYDHSVFDFCSSLTISFVKHLSNTSLELLTIENNNIVRIDIPSVAHWPKSIKYISVQHNMFLYGNYTPLLILSGVLNNLIYVDISRMSASNRPLQDYNVARMKPLFQRSTPQIKIASDFISICELMFTRYQVSDYFQVIENRLKQNNIDCDDTILENKTITLSSSKLEYLDMTENLPVLIERMFEVFPHVPNLKVLNVSKNYLGYPLYNNTDIIGQLKNIRSLDLSGNRIIHLNPDIFNNLTKLENLYLSHNLISNISFDLRYAKNLSFLDLEYNNLESIDKVTLETLDELPNIVINIANNNLKCSCVHINFFLWVERNKHKLLHIEDTMCTFENSSTISIANIDYERLRSQCSNYLVIITVSITLFLIIVVTVVTVLIRKYIRRIHDYFKRIRTIIPPDYQELHDSDNRIPIKVIYSEDDNYFVKKNILDTLVDDTEFLLLTSEGEAGLNLYKIGEAIYRSRVILIVLTKNYDEPFYAYTINMAIMSQIEAGSRKELKKIFVIQKDESDGTPCYLNSEISHPVYLYTNLEAFTSFLNTEVKN